MNKEEPGEKEIDLGKHKAKVTFASPKDQGRIDKLNAMRIALTYIEGQAMKATPEKAIKIADEFLEWLKK